MLQVIKPAVGLVKVHFCLYFIENHPAKLKQYMESKPLYSMNKLSVFFDELFEWFI